MLTQARLKELLKYDAKTGVFTWAGPGFKRRKTGVAGCWSEGYLRICLDGKVYLANRLAWLYVKGVWPTNGIDHWDTNSGNNIFLNLREATQSQNMCNRSKQANNTSGFKGVHWHKRHQKWHAKIGLKGKRTHLGYFDAPEEARTAYLIAAQKLHGEFARL